MNIIVFGSSYITSSILRTLLYLPDVRIIVIDRKDPHYALNQDVLAGVSALLPEVTDLKKNFDYIKSFNLNPADSLSFLYLNPITEGLQIYEELLKLSSLDIVLDSGMMSDPYYSEKNLIDTCNINTTYPAGVFSILSKLPYVPKLYINLSSGFIYGKQKELPVKETAVPNPAGMMAGSLLARENIVSSMCRLLDIPFITLRLGTPAGYYTPYESVLNQIIKFQLLNQPLIIDGDSSQISRDFFLLSDLSQLIFKIISNVLNTNLPEKPANQTDKNQEEKRVVGEEYINMIKNQVFNIGGSKSEGEASITLTTLDRLVTTALGKVKIPTSGSGIIKVKNSRMINKAYRNSENIEKNLHIQLDIDRAVNILDYEPTYNILDIIKSESIPYVAHNFLNYDENQMEDLKKQLSL